MLRNVKVQHGDARRFVTLLTALWKAGKTTMLCHLLHEIDDGGHLATDVACVKALVVSEEPASIWARRRDTPPYSLCDVCFTEDIMAKYYPRDPKQRRGMQNKEDEVADIPCLVVLLVFIIISITCCTGLLLIR